MAELAVAMELYVCEEITSVDLNDKTIASFTDKQPIKF